MEPGNGQSLISKTVHLKYELINDGKVGGGEENGKGGSPGLLSSDPCSLLGSQLPFNSLLQPCFLKGPDRTTFPPTLGSLHMLFPQPELFLPLSPSQGTHSWDTSFLGKQCLNLSLVKSSCCMTSVVPPTVFLHGTKHRPDFAFVSVRI